MPAVKGKCDGILINFSASRGIGTKKNLLTRSPASHPSKENEITITEGNGAFPRFIFKFARLELDISIRIRSARRGGQSMIV